MSAARGMGYGIISVVAGVVGIYALFAADRKRREAAHALPLTTALPVAFYRGQQHARERCGGLVRVLLRLRTTLVAEGMGAPSEDAASVLDDLGHELHLLGIDLWLGTPTNGARWIHDPIIGVGDMRPEWLREARVIATLPHDDAPSDVFEYGYQYEIAKSREVHESFAALAKTWKRPIDQDVSVAVRRYMIIESYRRIVAALERYGLACRPLPADWSFA